MCPMRINGMSCRKSESLGRHLWKKKLDNMKKVIADPDEFNVNIASRERVDELELRIKALEERMNGH